jgi:hypothetical protein
VPRCVQEQSSDELGLLFDVGHIPSQSSSVGRDTPQRFRHFWIHNPRSIDLAAQG